MPCARARHRAFHQGGPAAEAGAGPVDETQVRHGYATPMPFEPVYDYSYDAVMRSYEDSLQRLGLSRIDMLYIHDIGRLTHGEAQCRAHGRTDQGRRPARRWRNCARGGAISGFGMGVNEVPPVWR